MEAEINQTFFDSNDDVASFNIAFIKALAEFQKKVVSRFIPEENTQRFYHGGTWTTPANPMAFGGEMQTHSAILETKFDDIIENDLQLLPRSFAQIAESMQAQFVGMMYSTVSQAADKVGNVIDAKEQGSVSAAFLAMLEKMEFSADKFGNVHLPEIHTNPETAKIVLAALEGESQEFKDRVDAVKKNKSEAALIREAERKAKFARYGS